MERVRRMIHTDPDPQVLANCLTCLMQVEDFASLAADKALVYSLVNRIKEFTDWAQCQVMELCSHYTPGSESEVYDFLNALEDRMSHSNSAVVMAGQ
jgi:vesicle coat complex subunit